MKPEQLFMYHYKEWLEKFCAANKSSSTLTKAQLLLEDLKAIHEIDELIDLLENNVPKHHPEHEQIGNHNYGPITFNSKLLDWIAELRERKTQHQTAIEKLKAAAPIASGTFLIELLTEIIETPESILYYELKPVLSHVCDTRFFDVLKFIEDQPLSSPQPNPSKGSFAAIKPLCEAHRQSIALLINVAAVFDKHHDNPLYLRANGLLQESLKIYADFAYIEIKLNNDDEQATAKKDSQHCTLI